MSWSWTLIFKMSKNIYTTCLGPQTNFLDQFVMISLNKISIHKPYKSHGESRIIYVFRAQFCISNLNKGRGNLMQCGIYLLHLFTLGGMWDTASVTTCQLVCDLDQEPSTEDLSITEMLSVIRWHPKVLLSICRQSKFWFQSFLTSVATLQSL